MDQNQIQTRPCWSRRAVMAADAARGAVCRERPVSSLLAIAASLALFTACATTAADQQTGGSLNSEEVRADVAVFKTAFEELHPSLHRYASPRDVSAFFERAERKAGGIRTELDLYRALAPFASVLKDGHTDLNLSEATAAKEGMRLVLPMEAHLQGTRLWISQSFGEAPPAGSEIVSIDGVAAAELVGRALAAEPRDGNSESGPRYSLGRRFRFVRVLSTLLGERPSHAIRFIPRGATGVTSRVTKTLPLQELRRLHPSSAARPPVSIEAIGDVAVLTVRTFASGIGGQLREAVSAAVAHGRRSLIIDVRGNGGGMDSLGLQLFAHIASSPFTYYRSLPVRAVGPRSPLLASIRVPRIPVAASPNGEHHMTGHPNLGRHSPDPVNFKGPVIILMDGGSFSTTAEFLSAARAAGSATFVGEESGGAACGNTSGVSATVTLPNSRLRLIVPLVRYETAAACDGHGRGVLPDVEVPLTIDDIVENRDRQRERALEIARTAPADAAALAESSISSETPVWSPDGRRLAFSAGPALRHQIYVIDVDGTGARRLTDGPDQNRWPSWSPDGLSIVFMSDRDGQAELYVMRADGTSQRRLTHTPVHEFAPAWSPRGDAIAYVCEMPGSKQQISRMNADGTQVRQLDGDHLYYGRPGWSPDGSRLYVGANREPGTTPDQRWNVRSRLYAIAVDGTGIHAITGEGTYANPSVSPDGRTVLFDALSGVGWSSAGGEADLWMMTHGNSASAKRFTSGDSNDWGAVWSPDGRSIAFSTGRRRVYALAVITADGARRQLLTRTDRLPDAGSAPSAPR